MKNIAILTIRTKFIFSNFGSFLQHWALRRVLHNLGYHTRRVPLDEDNSLIAVSKKAFVIQYIKQLVYFLLHFVQISKFVKPEYGLYSFRKFKNARLFAKDYEEQIGVKIEPPLPYETAVIVGGDQVCKPYYLENALKVNSGKFITYSASSDWSIACSSDEWKESFKKVLPKFSALGLREQNGIDYLESIGFKADKVADPVILIPTREIVNIADSKPVFESNTLFCYLLNINNNKAFPLFELESLASSSGTKMKLNGIQGAELFIPEKYYVALSPCSYLRALIDAKYVVTNSYHGTVLAILLHKPFISLKQIDKKGANQNTRQEELLDWLQLSDHRITYDKLSSEGLSLLSKEICWGKVDSKITALRENSIKWLKQKLES